MNVNEFIEKYPMLIINFDDWLAVYRNGKLIAEGHSLHYLDWISIGFEMAMKQMLPEVKAIYVGEDIQEKYKAWNVLKKFKDFDKNILEYIINKGTK